MKTGAVVGGGVKNGDNLFISSASAKRVHCADQIESVTKLGRDGYAVSA